MRWRGRDANRRWYCAGGELASQRDSVTVTVKRFISRLSLKRHELSEELSIRVDVSVCCLDVQLIARSINRLHSSRSLAFSRNCAPHAFTRSSLHLTAGLPLPRAGPRGCHSSTARVNRELSRNAMREAQRHFRSLTQRTTSVSPVWVRIQAPVR